ncbi:MAG TPA: HNH endonuclease [Candidatus Acidoferrales bacterium]|nr:HNH endonuclease [Candidatus Acidoferrales bacterium]
MDKAPFTVEQYRQAFSKLNLSDTQMKLLTAHYLMPERTTTARSLANAMGWTSYRSANSHYGGLGTALIETIGEPWPKNPEHTVSVYALSKIWHDREWRWQMWPEVAEALEYVGLVESGWSQSTDSVLGPTDREAVIKQRVVQWRFRLSLLQFWEHKCSATGAREASMLIASHIKPWRICTEVERVDPYNGLLLTPNLDRAFDNGYISFADDGRVLIQAGREESLRDFGIHADLRLRKLDDRHRRYLAEHRRLHRYED